MTTQRAVWPWFLGCALLVGLDQWTKWLVRANFQTGESIRVLGDEFLRLTYVLNPGIAFGLSVPWKSALLAFGWTAAAALAVYLFYLVRRGDPNRWPIALFLSGAIGNSLDRTIYGEVTDFVDVDFPDFIMHRFAVFNVADSCVTIGVVLLLLILIFDHRKTPRPVRDNFPAPASASASSSDSVSTSDGSRSAARAD
jgi:signal peptidase II